MLHQAVSKDIAGQVPRRMWGEHHQYLSLWPDMIEVYNTNPNSPQNIPIPAAVASSLGWNQIPALISDGSLPDPFMVNTPTEVSGYDAFEVPEQKPVYILLLPKLKMKLYW
jgi:hypothetical protein